MKAPLIKTPLPGPKASEFIRADAAFVSPSYTRVYPLVVESARGMWVRDVDGNRFLDFTAGIAVNSTGHCHPEVVEAIRDQAAKLIHMSGTDFYYVPQIALAEKLAGIANISGQPKVFFANSGTEAIEASFKLARYHTRRDQTIAFFGAFHGRTMGALSLSASKAYQRKYYTPFVPGITHVPYPNCYRCPFGVCYPTCGVGLRAVDRRSAFPHEHFARRSRGHIRRTDSGGGRIYRAPAGVSSGTEQAGKKIRHSPRCRRDSDREWEGPVRCLPWNTSASNRT